MKVFLSPWQKTHEPDSFLVAGEFRSYPDVSRRINSLEAGAIEAGYEVNAPQDFGLEYISRVHDEEYISFLKGGYDSWAQLPGSSSQMIPNVHPRAHETGYPRSIVGRAGFHLADLACPVNENTWNATSWGAHSATSAAMHVRSGEAKYAYAMCRPPGHHAGRNFAAGFCYINSAAVATEVMREKFHRVAILDIDVHHGNGTQDIFYDRDDVLVVSLHGDPNEFYPFFAGYADETGAGAGEGANVNIPLPRGTDDEAYLKALAGAIEKIKGFGADALVVSLGFDGYVNDPLAFFHLTTDGFAAIGRKIMQIGLPTVLVQEGGYNTDDLGRNLAAFLGAFEPIPAE